MLFPIKKDNTCSGNKVFITIILEQHLWEPVDIQSATMEMFAVKLDYTDGVQYLQNIVRGIILTQ